VVGVVTGQAAHVQGDAGVGDHCLEEVLDQAGFERADEFHGRVHLVDEVGAAGQVDGHLGDGFVDRDQRIAEPLHAGAVAPCLGQRLAQRDAGVLHGVVGVDLQVALGRDGQVQATVAAQLVQHVVEERHPGVDIAGAGPVEVDLDQDLRLLGGPLDAGAA
jgi:hypothetical protein